ncbi:hypothetical protein Adt_05107 [Abeliophyllum distichum]|uniref:Uncharacterized protein n=1 Tax=Abeliophyllum distichum TaxID=126358 RepID=A0ABD1V3J1_9LAMI
MASKRRWRKRLPTPSFDDDSPLENHLDKCPVLIGKNIDLFSFTYDALSFHIEYFFVSMGWVSIVTLDEKAYLNLMKEFYQDMVYTLETGISCMVRNKQIKITQTLIPSILELEDYEISLYSQKNTSSSRRVQSRRSL